MSPNSEGPANGIGLQGNVASLRRVVGAAAITELAPANFGFVMATGIISIAADYSGRRTVSLALLGIAMVVYVALLVLNGLRVALHRDRVWADLQHPRTCFDFFTLVAATGVVGARLALAGRPTVPLVLWALSVLAWLVLTYTVAIVIPTRGQPELARSVGGSWLLLVVGTQSLTVLGSVLQPSTGAEEVMFFSLAWWLLGLGLYGVLIVFIVQRLLFHRPTAADLTPDYWITMGALAISTLAATRLLLGASRSPLLTSLHPFIEGLAIAAWAGGTWWLPVLVLAELWKLTQDPRIPRYDAARWAMVFPIGMYSVATYELSVALGFGWLAPLAQVFFWSGLIAWVVGVGALVLDLSSRLGGPGGQPTVRR